MKDVSLSSFAARDLSGRLAKAAPIAATLKDYGRPVFGRRPLLLDIGTGSGVTGKAVAEGIGADYVLMDTTDDAIADRSHFVIGSGEAMPFRSDTFDFIMANHVIEHVIDQSRLLREIERVLTPGGIAYMATPSKYTLIEPHYRLPFLSWLPQRVADTAVRISRRGDAFRVSPLTRGRLERTAVDAGLTAIDITAESISRRSQARNGSFLTKLANRLPEPLMQAALPVAPSHVWLLKKSISVARAA